MKIGIFGGTFDPIHVGHLVVAREILQKKKLDKILFLPSATPPHKQNKLITKDSFRLKMLEIALENDKAFEISTIDIDRSGVSYTYQTLEILNKIDAESEYYFIVGEDMVWDLENWKNTEKLFSLCSFLGMKRPNVKENYKSASGEISMDKSLDCQINRLKSECGCKIEMIDVPQVDVSSSKVRDAVFWKNISEQEIKTLIPERVYDFILENDVYHTSRLIEYKNILCEKYDVIKQLDMRIKDKLSNKRYFHSLGVMATAYEIANKYNPDIAEYAAIAGIAHDISKEEKDAGNLTHGAMGANYLKKHNIISDNAILDAISYHTTGRDNMSPLEKIIYIADYCEPSRKTPNLLEIRKIMFDNMELAFEMCKKNKDEYVAKKYMKK